MPIPESQLDTWSHQGSVTQSAGTYNAIKNVLVAAGTPYAGKNVRVFLQGSYGNDTNIYSESDVDVVITLDDCFHSDLTGLSDDEKAAYKNAFSDATYRYVDFHRDTLRVLTDAYGGSVTQGKKAIQVAAGGGRRKADVIVAVQFRRYHKFGGILDQRYDKGICFFDATGQRIANYPRQHADNMTAKHQSAGMWLKPIVRIFKNMRGRMIEKTMIAAGLAPSYYLEGLLYNVPDSMFTSSYENCVVNCINWIKQADRSQFVCANRQYYLLRDGSPVTWQASKCDEFLAAATKLWNEW